MNSADNKGYWQKVAKLYGVVMKDGDPMYREICAHIRPHLRRNMTVLELACGTGQLSYPLSSGVKLWEATDFSENMIAQAKKNNHSSKLHFSVRDATDLPYGDGTFDAVVISNALHIMPRPDLALSEARRVLKPGGLLFAPTFVWSEGGYAKLWALGLKLTGFKTYHSWTCKELEQFVTEQGFAVLKTEFLPNRKTPMCYISAAKEGAVQ